MVHHGWLSHGPCSNASTSCNAGTKQIYILMCKEFVLDCTDHYRHSVVFCFEVCQRAPRPCQQGPQWHHRAPAASVALDIFVTPRAHGLGTVHSKRSLLDSQFWGKEKHGQIIKIYKTVGTVSCRKIFANYPNISQGLDCTGWYSSFLGFMDIYGWFCWCVYAIHEFLLGMPSWAKLRKAKQPRNHGKTLRVLASLWVLQKWCE